MPDSEGSQAQPQDIVQEIFLPDSRGGRRPRVHVEIAVLRSLTAEDVPALAAREPMGTSAQTVLTIKHAHHQLARLLASGTPGGEVSLITGYSPAYISSIQRDPMFVELLEYYSHQREQVFVDTLERMKTLGLTTLDELQARLEASPEKWTNQQIMDLAELLLIKPARAAGGLGGVPGAGGGVQVNVTFVKADQTVVEQSQ